jgi:peptidoglycan hydrolase-like protein with peptidoglycan-binding domain
MTKISDAAIADYAVGAGFPKVAVPTAVAVALAESEGDPSATHLNSDVHKSTDYGLWQINGYWWADILRRFSPWSDPAQNARMAVTVWKDSRWSFDPWNTYKHGSHLKFMDRARAAYPATLDKSLKVRKVRYMRGGLITRVQRIVGADADGVYGPQTASAVQAWQKAHDLDVDGVVGPQTAASFGWLWKG